MEKEKADQKKYLDSTLPISKRVEDLLSRMTLEEKIAQLGSLGPERILREGNLSEKKADQHLKNGIGQISRIAGASALPPEKAAEASNEVQRYLLENTRLGIPAIIHEECLSGYMGKGGTTYPQSIGMASSWSPELMEQITDEIRKQMRSMGASLALSPLADVARDPRWGRIEETFGEDQYLVAEMANAYVKGLQGEKLSEGICATLKHFAGHGFCEGGRNHAPVNFSEREFREHFLFPYEAVIRKTHAGSIMNAYHDVDGTPCASSRKLLTDILRGEWEFKGIVVSDYFSIDMLYTEHKVAENLQEAGVKALEAGLDVELPEISCYGELLHQAVEGGELSLAVIDEAVSRHLEMKFRLGLFEDPFVDKNSVNEVFETADQRELSREAARKSMVLLKNEEDILPLDKDIESLALIGPSADSTRNLLGDYAYSAHVDSEEETIKIVSIKEGIENKLNDQCDIKYVQGCSIMGENDKNFEAAITAAEKSELAVVVLGGKSGLSGMGGEEEEHENDSVDFTEVSFTSEMTETSDTTGEHHDRTDLELPGLQQELLEAIYQTGTPVVLILVNGRPLSVEWADKNIPAIIEAWLPGEEGGNAAADVLFGDYNPGGKLPVSIPKNTGQLPINYNRKPVSHFRDYVFGDNRPLYPFGYGLSYTSFSYENLVISPQKITGSSEFEVEVEVKNTGDTAGEEIVQLYVNDPYAQRTRPLKELCGFKRVHLNPEESRKVKFNLSSEQLAFYDENMDLIIESGDINILVGSSSADIKLQGKLEILEGKVLNKNYRRYFTRTEVY